MTTGSYSSSVLIAKAPFHFLAELFFNLKGHNDHYINIIITFTTPDASPAQCSLLEEKHYQYQCPNSIPSQHDGP